MGKLNTSYVGLHHVAIYSVFALLGASLFMLTPGWKAQQEHDKKTVAKASDKKQSS